jgi:hypothetical protein
MWYGSDGKLLKGNTGSLSVKYVPSAIYLQFRCLFYLPYKVFPYRKTQQSCSLPYQVTEERSLGHLIAKMGYFNRTETLQSCLLISCSLKEFLQVIKDSSELSQHLKLHASITIELISIQII